MKKQFEENRPRLLTINGGSSSIRFASFDFSKSPQRTLHGKIERLGQSETRLSFRDAEGTEHHQDLSALDRSSSPAFLRKWLEKQPEFESAAAIGHRIVHGMDHVVPELVTDDLLAALRRIIPYDPEHLPAEISLIEEFRRHYPALPQVACFDTTFHRDLPRVAQLLPIPRRFHALGVRRYGFHGLSYEFLLEELLRLGDQAATDGRVLLAHLGNGASLAAVRNGKCIDTSMAFTPAAGLPMSTRSGDLDPGIVTFLARQEQMSAEQFHHMINKESGLLGVSGISSDLRELLAREETDPPAAEAVELFCYQARKWMGSFAAALGGLDTLVFAGGIGENQPVIRARICAGLKFLGIELDPARNAQNAGLISTDASRITVRVIRTDEELVMARAMIRLLGLG